MNNIKLKSLIESILFLSGEPVQIEKLVDFFKISKEELNNIILEIKEDKYSDNSGIYIDITENSVSLYSRPENYDIVREFFNIDKKKNLTNSAMEVLSIIAYKQPVTRAEIDNIRGVKSNNILYKLLDDGLIEISGKLDAPGLPNLYSTTDRFLYIFNISSLDDLPEIKIEEVEIWDYKNF